MLYLNFKTFLVGALMATSAFASNVSQEDESEDAVVRAPMFVSDSKMLRPDLMDRVVSFIPDLSLKRVQKFVGDFNFKTFLFSVVEMGSALASDLIREETNQSTVAAIPMLAGGFETLTSDAVGCIGSHMPVQSLDRVLDLVTVCKFFHAHVVPKMCFSWTPKYSSVVMNSKFVQAYASRVVDLNLAYTSDAHFLKEDMSKFTALTTLNLAYNNFVSDDFVKCLANLTHLDLTFNSTVTDDAVKMLSKLTGLHLHENVTITPVGYAHLPNLCVTR